MYIVTRTFRDANGVFGVGSIVDPTSIKAFRSRLQQRHIVDVDERNIEEWAKFFKNRHGIDLGDKLAEYLDASPEVEVRVDMQPTSEEFESEEELTPSEDEESW